MHIDVIILSRCISENDFAINCQCIKSLIESEKEIHFDIHVIESNPEFDYTKFSYSFPNVKVVIPKENFNYNRFLNIGLENSKNDLVAFCNNDLIFNKGWLSEIIRVKNS